jgi:uncharacterized membrane protein
MIDIAYAEWLELVFRWLHLIAGIAWIGSSFYFIFLDLSLRKRAGLPEAIKGEAWNVHGGGFYLMQKYQVAPAEMPDELHWFKWEAYFTWISGFALMIIIYYWGAESFLIDTDVMRLRPWQAIGISVGAFAAGWFIYDWLCKSPLGKNGLALSAVVFVLILLAAYGFTHVYSGRGAFVHVGALVGTIMVANVFFIIIPNQKIVVADLIAGREPAAQLGDEAKQRSTHNNYLTLPVLLMMISSHFPMIFSNRHSWVVVALVLIIGGIVRDYFNAKNEGQKGNRLVWQWPAAALFMAALMVFISYREEVNVAEDDRLEATDVLAIVQTRCSSCHAAKTTDKDFDEAPGGVKLETIDEIKKFSAKILKQAVLTNAMPLGNRTKMTKKERQGIGDWIKRGMPIDEN